MKKKIDLVAKATKLKQLFEKKKIKSVWNPKYKDNELCEFIITYRGEQIPITLQKEWYYGTGETLITAAIGIVDGHINNTISPGKLPGKVELETALAIIDDQLNQGQTNKRI